MAEDNCNTSGHHIRARAEQWPGPGRGHPGGQPGDERGAAQHRAEPVRAQPEAGEGGGRGRGQHQELLPLRGFR